MIRPVFVEGEVVAICQDMTYKLNLRDDIQRAIYFNAYEDESLLAQVLKLVSPGGTCLDAGANVGFYTLRLAQAVGPGGRVHAFEPDDDAVTRLQENLRLNGFQDRVSVYQQALTNKTGCATFYRSEPTHSGWGSLVEFSDIAVAQMSVPAITLDDFLHAHDISSIDFAKIDVEAGEFELLEGATQALSQQRIRYLLLEFNGIRLAQRARTLADLLQVLARYAYYPASFSEAKVQAMLDGKLSAETQVVDLLFRAGHFKPCGGANST
jgi:FkbM family methyltransferase